MQIKIRTGGRLRNYLPDGSSGSQGSLDIAAGTNVTTVMQSLGLPMDETYLVTLNGDLVLPDQRASTLLNDGDDLGLFPPLKSG